ncbi:hypothetical protein [Aeromonas veronii]|uniref:Uncharacterized protein n=2 Tax=Aeromonas veronii TaxID=654 RepID=A0AAW5M1P0_AERVE|nr:hypothetical protein [Aeromonas veronii]MCR4447159.1 hypothetical protein [Aeromonas veronii]TNI31833.1 hypothetical protein CF128_21840 [Aeromonas veronii]TNJ14013.1 hypothetical protein CF113_17755 [Aeromonas veronii]
MKNLRDYQPEIFGVIVALAVLNIWYLCSVAIDESVVPKSYDYLIRVLTVAAGGFIGAFSAFWLKSYEEGKKDKKKEKSALNSALFVLIRQINAIQCIKRDLDKYKTPFERGLSLPAMKPPDYSSVKQDIDSLQFLIDNDNAQILMELTIEQERFEQAINSINIRNEFYVNEVQPALSFHALNGRPLPLAEFEEKLGERLFQGAMNGAAVLYELVYASDVSLHERYTELRVLAKKLFPGEKFVAWVKM